jgi:hypothetical protein
MSFDLRKKIEKHIYSCLRSRHLTNIDAGEELGYEMIGGESVYLGE